MTGNGKRKLSLRARKFKKVIVRKSCILKQECIPVRSVSFAAVAVCWRGVSASVHAGIHNPRLGLDTPQAWVWTPPFLRPWPDHTPPSLGLDTPAPGRYPPWAWAWSPPPPRGQTDTCENITFANFVCGR